MNAVVRRFERDDRRHVIAGRHAVETVDPLVAVVLARIVLAAQGHREHLSIGEVGRQVEENVHVVGGLIGRSNDQIAVVRIAGRGGVGIEAHDRSLGRQAVDVDRPLEIGEHRRAARRDGGTRGR